MADNRLKIDIRRDKILERLRKEGKVRVSDLSRELGASVVTIRTDLDSLEQDGYLERVQGGAIQKARVNADWLEMESRQDAEKRRIAEEAARHLKDGSTLFINSGTTTRHLAVALKQHKSLNVVTNSLAVSMELGNIPSIHVILLGGEINTQYAFTYGEDAREQLKHYQADWAVLSIDGISDPGRGHHLPCGGGRGGSDDDGSGAQDHDHCGLYEGGTRGIHLPAQAGRNAGTGDG